MFIHQNLKKLREKNHFSQTQIAQFLGVTRAAYSSWENGIYQPNQKNLHQLATFFGVDITFFATEDTFSYKFLRLNKTNQRTLLQFADELYFKQLIPYHVHAQLSAGIGDYYDENYHYDTVYFHHLIQHDIASWIHGDSMEPKYKNNDVALIQKTGFDHNGEIYAVVYEDQTFIKKVYLEEQQVRLVSLNKKYQDLFFPIADVRIVGKVVASFIPIEEY